MRYARFLPVLALAMTAGSLRAQTAEDSVRTAVNLLFTGMKASDAATIRRSFTDSAILQTIANRQGQQKVESEKVEDFATVVAKMTPGDADERIELNNLTIRIDGPLAMVWAPYEFYYKGKYSHKGVDSFQLIRVDGVWKIQYLIDTRRK
jgi:hypothetical protein